MSRAAPQSASSKPVKPVFELVTGTQAGRIKPVSRFIFANALTTLLILLLVSCFAVRRASAVILWSDLGANLAHETGDGTDILGGSLHEDENSTNTLYFKFRVDPISDVGVEPYFAAFQLYQNGTERMAIGNSLKAWAYSAFNTSTTGQSNRVYGDIDLNSSRPEPSGPGVFFPYEFPRRGFENTFVFKVEYVPGDDAYVTLWLNPDLSPGATELKQDTNLITRFRANAIFNEIRLRHGGGGGGWSFSDMAIATSFNDFVSDTGSGRDGLSFTFRSWQSEQGLPLGGIHTMTQTGDGYLWLGGDNGVARFDGVRFVFLSLREGVGSGSVKTLFGDSHGALWIGSDGTGLIRLEDGKSTLFSAKENLPSDTITCMTEDAEQHLWVGTDAGLTTYFHGMMAPLRLMREFKGNRINCLFRDPHGNMWVCVAGRGVYKLQGEKFTQLPDPTSERLLQNAHCVLVDKSGKIWIGAGEDFVLCRDGARWLRYELPHHLGTPYVTALAEEPDGAVWAGSVSEGLFQFRDGKLTPVYAGSGLSDNQVQSLLVDQEGKLWVGTDAGLNRIRTKKFVTFGQNQGLGQGAVQGLAEVSTGAVWAGKPGGGLYRSENRSFSKVLRDLPLEKDNTVGSLITLSGQLEKYQTEGIELDPQVNTLATTHDGACWVGTARGLIQFRNPVAPSPEPERIMMPGESFTALAEDGNGSLWAGTTRGHLFHRQSESWTAITNLSVSHTITSLAPDGDGGLWVGTAGDGLHQVTRTGSKKIDKNADGLESDYILSLLRDSRGILWVGTGGGGLSRHWKGQFKSFTTREGLPDNSVTQILEDSDGRLWFGSEKGVACETRMDIEDFLVGKSHSLHPQIFGQGDGMPSERCTSGFAPAGLKTHDGLLYFATQKGLAMVNPKTSNPESQPPKVLIEEVLLDGEPLPGFRPAQGTPPGTAPQILRIPPGRHRIEFRYTGLGFNEPERVRFHYQLEGMDSDWVEAGENGTRRTASYGYVPPGSYHFTVSACNSAGVWNPNGAVLDLSVQPYIWQTWWFISLSIVALLTLIIVAVRIQEKAKIQRRLNLLEQERALQRERARIAQDLHDDLGSSLTRISLLSTLAKADKDHPNLVEHHTDKISQSAEQTVRALEEIVWAVRPGSDSLQSLVEYISHFANELFESDTARCRLDFPSTLPSRPLPPEVRHDFFLVVKEALTNALRHAKATEVRVHVTMNGDRFEVMVQDDGRGFEMTDSPNGSFHNGLGNMKRRAENMSANLAVQSAPSKGTQVRISILVPDTSNGKKI